MKNNDVFEINDVVDHPIKVVESIDEDGCLACSKCILLHICVVPCSLPAGYIFVFADKL